MDLKLYSRLAGGTIKTIHMPDSASADRAFNEHKKLIEIPWAATYRVTLTDPMLGGYISRDTDLEVFGIKGRLRESDPTT